MGERTTTIGKLVAASLVALFAVLGAILFEPFERFWMWAQSYARWRVDELVVVPGVLAIAIGLYYWRKGKEREREITQRERVEEGLRSSEARYRAVVTSLPVALFAVDP